MTTATQRTALLTALLSAATTFLTAGPPVRSDEGQRKEPVCLGASTKEDRSTSLFFDRSALIESPAEAEEAELKTRLADLQSKLEAARKEQDNGSARSRAERRSEIRNLETEINALQKSNKQPRALRLWQVAPGSGARAYGYDFKVVPDPTLTPEQRKQREELLKTLDRRIDVEFRDATIRQAAETMSRASSVRIDVDKDVPREKRLTVTAHAMPLRTVLEQVARQTGLIIAPEENGVLLRPAASLEVNNRQIHVMNPNAPWSSDWGGLALLAPFGGLGSFGGFAGPNPFEALPTVPDVVRGYAVNTLGSARQSSGPVSMTALGNDMFVVASPAPAGSEAGVILTVYRLEGTQLRVVTSTFHRFGKASSEAAAPPAGEVKRP